MFHHCMVPLLCEFDLSIVLHVKKTHSNGQYREPGFELTAKEEKCNSKSPLPTTKKKKKMIKKKTIFLYFFACCKHVSCFVLSAACIVHDSFPK